MKSKPLKKKASKKEKGNNFMKLNVSSKKCILEPAHKGDAGYDVTASSSPTIIGDRFNEYYFKAIDYIEYDTDLVIEPEEGIHSLVFPRSSISKTNLVLCNSIGLIDNGYRGTVKLRFKYIAQPIDYIYPEGSKFPLIEVDTGRIYKKGDKIGQIVFAKTILADSVEEKTSFIETTRNSGGFGSTGK
jgi:dUTPase